MATARVLISYNVTAVGVGAGGGTVGNAADGTQAPSIPRLSTARESHRRIMSRMGVIIPVGAIFANVSNGEHPC